MNVTGQSDGSLLERMAAGSEEAFTCLYHRYQARVYRFAWQMSGSKHLAEEATQETFLALLDGVSGFDSGRGSLPGYLMGIARNQVLRLLRRDGAYVPLTEDGEDEDAGREPAVPASALADLTRREMVDSVRQAILTLPAAYREAVVLCDLQEMDYSDAAAALGCAEGTLKSRLHRGRTMLVARLKPKQGTGVEAPGAKPARCWV